MPWKDTNLEQLAKSLGANLTEVKEKQRLIALIVKIRKSKKLSQIKLAKTLGVSQARVAQIESGVGTAKVTFDVIFGILSALGYDYRIITKRAA